MIDPLIPAIADADFTPTVLRARWSLDPDIHFLNHGSFGATPRVVQAAQQRWRDTMEQQPVRFMLDRLPPALDAARAALAGFTGAALANLVLVENATAGANAVLHSLDWRAGERIVIANHAYPAVRHLVRHVAARFGLVVVEAAVPWPLSHAGDLTDAYVRALRGGARLLIVDHVFSPLAVETPLAEILAAARAQGTRVLIDGAHAPGLLPLDLEALAAQGMDWYTGNGHKWLCAPKGAGFLYATPAAQRGLHPAVISNDYGEGFVREFGWTGTGDFTARLCVPESIAFLQALGVARYRQKLRALAAEATACLADAWKVSPGAPLAMCPAMVTLPLPGDEAGTAAAAVRWRRRLLDEYRVEVPLHAIGGRLWVRLSAQVYNELADYQALARAVMAMQT